MAREMKKARAKEMFVAREKDGSLFLFIGERPVRVFDEWMIKATGCVAEQLDGGLFPGLKWEDDPVKVVLAKEDEDEE